MAYDFVQIDTVAEYQRRSMLASKYGYPFVVSTALSVIGLIILMNTDNIDPVIRGRLFLIALFGVFISMIIFFLIQSKYNRCPNCERMPITALGEQFPLAVCPKCGARLRPY
jgi:heme/copper-type cytochrome/quinol oxidase subunit 4